MVAAVLYPEGWLNTWDVAGVRDRVGKRVAESQRTTGDPDDISPDVGALLTRWAILWRWAKRLRAMFLYWGWRSAGRPDGEEIVSAAAMEFLQACALVHDDVMDCSDLVARAPGDPPAVPSRCTKPPAGPAVRRTSAMPLPSSSATQPVVGRRTVAGQWPARRRPELRQTRLRRDAPNWMAGCTWTCWSRCDATTGAAEAALQVATHKSAKYTFIERPLHLRHGWGGTGRDRGPASLRASLGGAFQPRDDCRGLRRSARRPGKPAGDDLREGNERCSSQVTLSELGDADRAGFAAGLESGDPAGCSRLRDLTPHRPGQMEDLIANRSWKLRGPALTEAPLDPQAAEVLAQLRGRRSSDADREDIGMKTVSGEQRRTRRDRGRRPRRPVGRPACGGHRAHGDRAGKTRGHSGRAGQPDVWTRPYVRHRPHRADDAGIAGDAAPSARSWADWLSTWMPLDPIYRTYYPRRVAVDVHSDPACMAAEIETVIGPDEAAGYLRYVDFLTELYDAEFGDFIDRNTDYPWNLLTPNLARLVRMGGFRGSTPGCASSRTTRARSGPCRSRRCTPGSPFLGPGDLRDHLVHGLRGRGQRSRGDARDPGRAMAARPPNTVSSCGTAPRWRASNARAAGHCGHHRGRRTDPADVVVVNADLPVAHRDLLDHNP